jgi:hypothetical protein
MFVCGTVFADEPVELEEIEVVERSNNLVGRADNATEGTVGAQQLQGRPLARVGEALETVPGLIATQHSGSGKANQYFLRGFNLDHGTDFSTTVDGMPINFPTHGHGQGYLDLNFMIPELVKGIKYRKGPYYADQGDFSSAGAAHIEYFDELPQNFLELTAGMYDYYRTLGGGSLKVGDGHLLGAVEATFSNGPWDVPEKLERYNGVLRYGKGDNHNGFNVTAMGYRSSWTATDQLPQRAVDQGLVSRLGTIDPSDGGHSERFSLSGTWRRGDEHTETHVNAYFIDYKLNLFSNFTYYLADPVRGDQIEQADSRQVYGGHVHKHWFGTVGGFEMENTAGVQLRFEDIDSVGLFHTQHKQRLDTTREDKVEQLSVSPYVENRTQWLPKFRTVCGLRGDFYHFDVDSNITENSGSTNDGIVNPKLSLIFGPWANTEVYISLGKGFHSNDGRGTTISIDPKTRVPVRRVNALVETRGAEMGIRTAIIPGLQSTLTGYLLDIDSELLFVGDAGVTQASRPSRRYGVEFDNYYTPLPWLTLDADLAFATSAFTDNDPAGNSIPGAVEGVIAAGVTVHDLNGFFGSMRLRYFGPRPLIADNTIRSNSTTLVNAEVGYEFDRHWRLGVAAFNIFDSRDHDIDYLYESQLRNESGPVADRHFHPVEPASVRVSVTGSF